MNRQTPSSTQLYKEGLRKSVDLKYVWRTMPSDVYPLLGALTFACGAAVAACWYGYTRDVTANMNKRKEHSRPLLNEPSFRYITMREQFERSAGKH